MTTNNNNTTVTNNNTTPVSSSTTTVVPNSTEDNQAPTINGWAGALWSVLLEITGMNAKQLEIWLTSEINDLNMQSDLGASAARQAKKEATQNAKATRTEGAQAIATAGITLAGLGVSAVALYKSNNTGSKAQLEALQKTKQDNFGFRKEDSQVGNLRTTGRTANDTARIQDLSRDGRFLEHRDKVPDENNQPVGMRDRTPEEVQARDATDEIYDKMTPDEWSAAKDKLDAQISQLTTQVNNEKLTLQHTQQMITGEIIPLGTSIAQAVGAYAKANHIESAGKHKAENAIENTMQSMAAQSGQNLKSMMDKASDNVGSLLQQIMSAISTSIRS